MIAILQEYLVKTRSPLAKIDPKSPDRGRCSVALEELAARQTGLDTTADVRFGLSGHSRLG